MAAPPPPPAVATVSSVIDLTDQPVIDLTASDRTEGSAPLSGRGVLIERRERLRDLIAREREEAEATAPVVALHRAADVAPFPLPPLEEQHRIVTEVDRCLSIVREVEAKVDVNLNRAQVLRHAVLSRAFAVAPEAVPSRA